MRQKKYIFFALPVIMVSGLTHCNSFGKFWLAPPANLNYAASPYVFTLNAATGNITPTVKGSVESCVASPPLPAGLTLGATTCTIAGIPTAIQAPMTYTITAANEVGNTTTTISIEINANPPSAPVYAGSPYVFTQGTAITPLTPAITGAVTSCAGALPPGLALDSACVISGTPTTVSVATNYSITATNAFGAGAAGTINITVNAETTPPSTPTAFNGTGVSQTQIDLTWTASTDNITAQASIIYEICRSVTAGVCTTTFTVTHTTTAGAVAFSSTALTAGTTYYFVIRAKDAANNFSAVSAEISATTNVAGTVSNPIASPVAGLYSSAQSVSWSVASPAAATICYTTNGTAPACDVAKTGCAAGTLYSIAIALGTTDATVKAIGCKATYADSAVSSSAYTFDTAPPTVTGVTTSAANGTYTVGNVITIQINFSEIVNVAGTPTLSLSTGSPATTAINYASGSGTTTLNFAYTIASGNSSPDLDYASTAALTAGTSIQDAALNNAALTLPAPGGVGSLGGNKDIVVNPPPTVISSTPLAGAQVLCQNAPIVVNFSKAMNQVTAEGAFSLSPAAAGSFSWTGNTMTFTPSAALPVTGSYTYTVSTAAQSSEGVPLGSAYSRSFNGYRGKMYTIQGSAGTKVNRFEDGEGLSTQIAPGATTLSFGLHVDVDTQRDILYAADGSAGKVYIWYGASTTSASPNVTLTIGGPAGLVIDKANDRLYVANYAASSALKRIYVFNGASTLPTSAPSASRTITYTGTTTVTGLRGMAIDFTRDILYQADFNNTGASTGYLYSWDSASTINGAVVPNRIVTITNQGPSGVSVDEANDRLYLSTYGTANVHIFDNASTLNGAVAGGTRVLSGGLTTLVNPNSVHFVPELNRLYVADAGAGKVSYWNSASTVSGSIAPNATMATTLTTLTDVFFDPLR